MPVCKKCGKIFGNRISINGVWHNVSKRKFCIDCSPFGTHNTRIDLLQLPTGFKQCSRCKKIKPISEFYNSSANRKYGKHSFCKDCHKASTATHCPENKLKSVEYLGGKCIKCGYSECADAMDFHHRDPTKKEANINKLLKGSFEKLKLELDKCDLMCCRCHRELHADENKPL